MNVPARAHLSIGEVLARLRSDFPDVTISKIRFLESEGLIEPQRTPSGYRKFTSLDLERLRYVLSAQRDQYLPLRVIKENLDALDRGLTPSSNGTVVAPRLSVTENELTPEHFAAKSELRLSREELLHSANLDANLLEELEAYGLISSNGKHYDADALSVARAVSEISAFGIEPRHLRAFKAAADRELGLVEQVIAPILRSRGSEAVARAQEVSNEIAALSLRLHAALVRQGLHQGN